MTMMVRSSRVGRKPVVVPSGVDVKIQDKKLTVKGPKGNLTVELHPYIQVKAEDNKIHVQPINHKSSTINRSSRKLYRSIAGTTRANIHNSIHGVSAGFERKLQLVGVGYRAQAKGKVISLSLGFSHPTDFTLPEGVTAETPTQTEILIKGADKNLVGLVAAKIRAIRGPEPYKGKGIRYANEIIEIKETKKK